MRLHTHMVLIALGLGVLTACSPGKQLSTAARQSILEKQELQSAHVGISVYDVDTDTYLYNYQGNKYFVPASNTKLFTLYAGLRFLGDSLPAVRYTETLDSIYLLPTGDPSLLHPDFDKQPVIDWLKSTRKEIVISEDNWKEKEMGYGWSWDDYNSAYMAERSPLPVYGNTLRWTQMLEKAENADGKMEEEAFIFSEPEVSWKVDFNPAKSTRFGVTRNRYTNAYTISQGTEILRTVEVPFVTNGVLSALDLLRDTIGRSVTLVPAEVMRQPIMIRYSQPTDTLLQKMMYRSDNFYAEQVVLMAAQEVLGYMNTGDMIDILLKKELNGVPHAPTWVDGSGLSRYNLFTPQDFIWILKKMEADFGRARLEAILPGADQGTLQNYYKAIPGAIHAKTGTLSGHVALSGYLTTKKGKRLLFSVLVNNHKTSATVVRRSVEAFLQKLWESN